jgi:pimeloyl-ACP methyl ester carboxylesterase
MTYEAFGEIPVRTGTFRAVVRAGATVTSYERTGAGNPVLLLVGPDADIATPFWQAIRKAIGAQFRLVVPDPGPTSGDLSGWLGNFLDGLGVGAASFVADEEVGVAVIGFALLAPDRVSRLVLVSNDCPDVPDLDGAVGDQDSTHPLLVVRAAGDPEAVAASVVRFLAGG